MRVTVLSVPGCPHAEVALERVWAAAAGHPDASIESVTVMDGTSAEELGMHGSPTVLVDGVDPFAPPDAPCSFACRFDPSGDPVPSVSEIAAALTEA